MLLPHLMRPKTIPTHSRGGKTLSGIPCILSYSARTALRTRIRVAQTTFHQALWFRRSRRDLSRVHPARNLSALTCCLLRRLSLLLPSLLTLGYLSPRAEFFHQCRGSIARVSGKSRISRCALSGHQRRQGLQLPPLLRNIGQGFHDPAY